RADRHDEPAPGGFHHTAGVKESGFDFVIETDDDDDEVAGLRHFTGRIADRNADGRVARIVNRVIAANVVTLGNEVSRHRRAHLAEAEHSNFAYCVHRGPSASISTRRFYLM